jgi:lipopolysaccharide biosynthesis glycosyltransferase
MSAATDTAPTGVADGMAMSPKRNIGPFVLASDERYATQLATTLRSIADSNPHGWPFEVYVLTDGIRESTQRRVQDSLPAGSVSLRWVQADLSPFKEFATADHISAMTYARFLIPHIVDSSISRILYLDSDLLVLDDLAALWAADLEGAVLGAVLDNLDAQIKANDPKVDGVPRVGRYFNAGVLLIDLERWRRERVSERAFEYLAQNPQSPFSDQDALNVVCDARWAALDPRWNLQALRTKSFAELSPNELPGILHFVTSQKPWKPSSLSVNASFYDAFRSRTAFARTAGDIAWEEILKLWYRAKYLLLQRTPLRALRNTSALFHT